MTSTRSALPKPPTCPATRWSLTFDIPAASLPLFAFKPGQHLTLRRMFDGEDVRRNYSICAGPDQPLRIAIKKVAGGRFSTWAHATLKASDIIDVMPPSGRFILPPSDGTPRQIIAFAAGSGITPILGIIDQALDHDTQTRVTLVYGNRTRSDTLFGEDLEALKDRHLGRFDLIQTFTADDADSPLFEGRITAEKVVALGDKLVRYGDAQHIFLCGPGSLIKDTRKALIGLGVPVERIHHEFFAAGGGAYRKPTAATVAEPAAAASTPAHEVVVILDGSRHRLALASGQHVLDAALKAGVKAPYACAGGMCCTCRARIVEGKADMTLNYSLEQWEIDKGFVLTCQAVPTTARLVVDYDAM